MKKRMIAIIVVGLLVGCSSPTGSDISSEVSESEAVTATTEEIVTTVTEEITEPTTETETPSNVYEKQTYREVLENIYYYQKLPDWQIDDYDWDITKNEFLIYDIDNDGRDELIINFTESYGMLSAIYDHNSDGNIIEQLRVFPLLTFYDNGVIEVGLSHNQGQSGRFWPYVMYQYDAETDEYREVGYIEALDEEIVDMLRKQQEDAGKEITWEYPYDVDTSGTGLVYYIYSSWREIGDVDPVDLTEYEKWHDRYTDGKEPIELPFMKLTEDNIKKVEQ